MKRPLLLMSRVIALTAIVLSVGMIPPATSGDRMAPRGEGAEAKIEVRLRKLHLVRPDLIPYPIHYDVYC
jgi:hypothetical protein